jgi:peptide deformylase
MALLPIIVAPDPRLKQRCAPVVRVDATLRQLMDDMLETMYEAPVDVLKRIIVVDIAKKDEPKQPYRMANPELIWVSDEDATYDEGCLSLPEHYAEVARPARCKVRYLDHENEMRELEADGLLATCVQHEMDHLDGILFVDHISALKRNMILRKLLKTKKSGKAAQEPAQEPARAL